MSPYLLANTFQVDFYSLYKAFNEQQEAKKNEKDLSAKLQDLKIARAGNDTSKIKELEDVVKTLKQKLFTQTQEQPIEEVLVEEA